MRQNVRQSGCSQKRGCVQQFAVNRSKGGGHGLHREGKTIQNRSKYEAFERERKATTGERMVPAPQWSEGTDSH